MSKRNGKTAPREHMRCVLCGRIAPIGDGTLPAAFSSDHIIEVRVQAFTGNGKQGPGTGFKWSERPLTSHERRTLAELVGKLAARLDQTDDDGPMTSAQADQYLRDGERALEAARLELEFRRKEVELLKKERP